jgi:beta-glucosidase
MVRRISTRGRSRALSAIAAAAVGVAVWGAAPAFAAITPTIGVGQPVYTVNPGGTAQVAVTLVSLSGGTSLDRAIAVDYQTGTTTTAGSGSAAKTLPSTAVAGTDYTAATGSVSFPAGATAGTVINVPVQTLPNSTASVALTINMALTSDATNSGTVTIQNDPPTVVINAHGLPYLDPTLPVSTRVADLMSRMTQQEKVGQMMEGDRTQFGNPGTSTTSNTTSNDVRAWTIGSILSGSGDVPSPNSPAGWTAMVNNYELRSLATRLQIPLIYGEDSVHGDGNMAGATVFPHNIGMGATRDPALAVQEGQITAEETRATGPQWTFAPCLCIARDDRWGRTYESFGEDPLLADLMQPEIDGLQGSNAEPAFSNPSSVSTDSTLDANNRILATGKHFAGDGGTSYGTGDSGYKIDQGVDVMDSTTFQNVFVQPYFPAVQQHMIGSIMPSYSSVQLDGASCPTKMSASQPLLTGDLKGTIGFQGFLISDYNALQQIGDSRSCPNPSPLPTGVPDAFSYEEATTVNAGMDMLMLPTAYQQGYNDLNTLVNNTVVPMSRVDDAVKRILTQKFELGLFEHPMVDTTNQPNIGDAAHRAVAAKAVAESLVLLKNAGSVLPLAKTDKLYVAGSNASNLGNQAGGWTLAWQGASGAINDTGTTILQGLQAADPNVTFSATATAPTTGFDAGVVVVGEHAYAEGQGDVGQTSGTTNGAIASLNLTTADHQAVDTVCQAMPCVVVVVSGRSMTVADQLPEIQGLVAAWLPGLEGEGVASGLFGDTPFTGRLPQTWPRTLAQEPINVGDASYDPQFPYGWGLRTDSPQSRAQTAANALSGGDGHSAAAKAALAALAAQPSWNERDVLLRLEGIGSQLDQTSEDTWTVDNLVTSLARDYAQQAPIDAGTSTLTSNAEEDLLSGNIGAAVTKLATAAGFASTSASGSTGGTVPATLSLTLGTPAAFGAFTPGVAADYTASMSAGVISTAGDATLSVSDPSSTATGHLVNGSFSLPQPLQADATSAAGVGGAFAPVGGSASPTALLAYAAPVSNDAVTVGFMQSIGSTDALRTGTYSKTLTFTLSTTTP